MLKQGTTCQWLPNGDCRTTTAVLPAIRRDARTGKQVFFNSVIAAFTGWNDARNRGDEALVFGDGTPMDSSAVQSVADFMAEKRVAFKWQNGDVLLIDNTLVMHSRDTLRASSPCASLVARTTQNFRSVFKQPWITAFDQGLANWDHRRWNDGAGTATEQCKCRLPFLVVLVVLVSHAAHLTLHAAHRIILPLRDIQMAHRRMILHTCLPLKILGHKCIKKATAHENERYFTLMTCLRVKFGHQHPLITCCFSVV